MLLHRGREGAAQPHAGNGRLVEVQRVHRRGPGALLREDGDAGERLLIGRFHFAAARHIRLSGQQEYIPAGLGQDGTGK